MEAMRKQDTGSQLGLLGSDVPRPATAQEKRQRLEKLYQLQRRAQASIGAWRALGGQVREAVDYPDDVELAGEVATEPGLDKLREFIGESIIDLHGDPDVAGKGDAGDAAGLPPARSGWAAVGPMGTEQVVESVFGHLETLAFAHEKIAVRLLRKLLENREEVDLPDDLVSVLIACVFGRGPCQGCDMVDVEDDSMAPLLVEGDTVIRSPRRSEGAFYDGALHELLLPSGERVIRLVRIEGGKAAAPSDGRDGLLRLVAINRPDEPKVVPASAIRESAFVFVAVRPFEHTLGMIGSQARCVERAMGAQPSDAPPLRIGGDEPAEPSNVDAFRFTMPDDSMAPTIEKGEHAIVSPAAVERDGIVSAGMYLVESEYCHGRNVRKLVLDEGTGKGLIDLIPANDNWQGVAASRREVKVVARVVAKVVDYD